MLSGDIADKHIEKARLVADRMLPKPVDVDRLLNEFNCSTIAANASTRRCGAAMP
jgi:hypothetical protein